MSVRKNPAPKRMHVETQNVEQQVTESKTEPNDDAS